MRPDGLFGVLTTTMRVRGVMAAAIASTSRSKLGWMAGTLTGTSPASRASGS
jgi:hypothetical protein